jgi:SpoIID/LytB domain protein
MRSRLALILTLCAGLLLVSGTAGAETTFTFYGSGWGHGIGMSQYGALGLAQNGWGANRIIRHYYRGADVREQNPPLNVFRIGLLQYRQVVNLNAVRGSFLLKLSNGTVIERVGEGKSRRVVIRDGRYRIRRPNGTLVGRHAWGSASVHLRVFPVSGAVIGIPEWGHKVKRGSLEFQIVASRDAHLVVRVAPELYLRGIGEVPSLWPAAALAAQAIAARTYAYRIVRNLLSDSAAYQSKWAACRCHLYGTTADQNYTGWDKEADTYGDRWVNAVQSTAKRVVRHNGSLITTYYSSSSGGHTENIEKVWTWVAPQPYLKGVCDPREDETSNPNEFWRSGAMSGSTIAAALRNSGLGVGATVRLFTDFNRGVSGRVATVKVVGSARSRVVAGWTLRRVLGLRDTRFMVNANHNILGRIRDRYDALGCAPRRAAAPQRAIDGGRFQAFQVGRLYLHAARDAVTWIRGPILSKYVAKSAHRGFLGLPYQWRSFDGGAGRRAWFDGGQILWKTNRAAAYEIHRPVLGHYLSAGGFSQFGYPITDVVNVDDGDGDPATRTRRSVFDSGTITCVSTNAGSTWNCTS